jgi:hypothetical protein
VAIRVSREEFGMLDPIGSGGTGGGVPVYDDGTRTMPWMDRPWKGKEDYVVSEAMRQMIIPADEIRGIRPPVPYQLFPEPMGYTNYPLTISEVLDTDRWAPQQRSWVSGAARPVTRREIEEQAWSGSFRNVSSNWMG